MHPDEQAIRELIERWARATAAGDIAELMTMMTEDVVFLTPGQGPMRRDDFTAGFLAAIEHVRIEAQSQLQEVEVVQDLAYAWNYLDVCVTPRAGGTPKRRSGYTLTILRKLGGAWVIARDANLLAPGL
jgi:uncharacterized protein (TIGR02246 family)